jgi:hypothetical protein
MSSRKWMYDTFIESSCRVDPRSRSAAFESIPFKSYEASKFKSYARSSFLKGIESRVACHVCNFNVFNEIFLASSTFGDFLVIFLTLFLT